MNKSFYTNYAQECDLAIQSNDVDKINTMIEQFKSIESQINDDIILTHILYCFSNLYSAKAALERETVNLWRNDKFPPNRVQSLNFIRQSYSKALECNSLYLLEIQTNMANSLKSFNRILESIYYYTFDYDYNLGIDSQYIAPFNKAACLMSIKDLYEEKETDNIYAFSAYKIINELHKYQNRILPEVIKNSLNEVWIKNLLNWGNEAQYELNRVLKEFQNIKFSNKEQNLYYTWCRENKLFLNPLNDLNENIVISEDNLQFPSYIVNIGEGPYFPSAFSDIKNSYCKARYLLYCGLYKNYPEWLEKGLHLTTLHEYENYAANTEYIKFAYKEAFSILDRLSALINKYFNINCKGNCSFKPTWFQDNFKNIENPYIDALFWLSCDLTDIANIKNWTVPNPKSSYLRKLRNNHEHNWVRISEIPNTIWNGDDDYAQVCSLEALSIMTIEIFKYVRTAIFYFIFAAKINADKKAQNLNGKLIPRMDTPLYNGHL